MARIQLSKNFYLDEFTRSQTAARFGIDNSVQPGSLEYNRLYYLCINILQPIRDALGPVTILSGFRCLLLNKKIGGSQNSQHTFGLAADFVVPGYTTLEVVQWCKENLKNFDQLIHEFGEWVHISGVFDGTPPRREVLTAIKIPRKLRKPKTVYLLGAYSMAEAHNIYQEAA